jgi:nicotinate-nucleotide adenylyltransferase
VFWLQQPPVPHAASLIRARIAAGDAGWGALVPAPVAAYIREHGLYGSAMCTGP